MTLKKLKKNINNHIRIISSQKNYTIKIIQDFFSLIVECIDNKNKVLIAGNGGSASDAQHFATELTVKMSKFRRSLPFISLSTDTSAITAIGNDYNFNKIFSRQLEGVGSAGDIFIPISTSGNSKNIIEAIKIAKRKKILVLGILGNKGGKAKKNCDLSYIVNSSNPSRVQESHIIFYQNLSEMLEDHYHKVNEKN